MNKKVVLVQVNDRYGPNKFLPLAISYQWLSAQEDPWVKDNFDLVDVLIEKLNPHTWINGITTDLDFIIMSCYVWNWKYNQTLARLVKLRWPNCKVIVGGPQIPINDPHFVKNSDWCDVAVLGENEGALSKIFQSKNLKDLDGIPGILVSNSKKISLPERTYINDVPSPILSGFFDWIIEKTERQQGSVESWHLTWETMRGCPYHCSFCDIGHDYWNKVQLFDIDRIKAEIEWIGTRKIEFVGLCDSNWGLFERDIKITQMIIDSKLFTGYPKIFDVTWAKNNPDRVREIVRRDQEAGTDLFRGIGLSMQTLSSDVLSRISRFNMQEYKTYDALRYYQEKQIPTWTELIWPLPGETLESFKIGLQKLLDIGQHGFLSVHPLVVTHNAPIADPDYMNKNQIFVRSVPLDMFWVEIPNDEDFVIETVNAVYSTDTVSFNEMLQGHMFAHWLVVLYYYGWAHYVMRWLKIQGICTETKFVSDWIDYWISRTQSLVSIEHRAVWDSLYNVFEHSKLWGRKVSKGGDLMWEYKSSTCVNIHHNRDQWKHDLEIFLKDCYSLDLRDLVDLNFNLCADWRRKYPYQYQTRKEYARDLLKLSSGNITINHHDQSVTDDFTFVKKAYHWRRRNLYWRCQASTT